MRALIIQALNILILPFVIIIYPVLYLMTKTGAGIELCRKLGIHPLKVHFYEPIPDYEKLPNSFFDTPKTFPGFAINEATCMRVLKDMGKFAAECQWPEHPQNSGYYAQNQNFGYSSACILHSYIRALKTKRIIEIGSGFSTMISYEALSKNCPDGESQLTCIEPYPTAQLLEYISQGNKPIQLLREKVQDVSFDLYEELSENDILFIDSSHVSKLASDVNVLYLDVLPRLKKGVVVHIHDIYIPYDYPKIHFYGRQKIFWNEQYMLQAFLSNNPFFETVFPAHYIQRDYTEDFKRVFNEYNPEVHRPSSSFWIKKVA